ncbi:hypothetical protein JKA74_16475 [Marivirga sp. S37H4]|uniref:VWA domain-containing protein n=1 Tax=Marivirga aurantiaca TaxID=2802615 RepID=A0A934X0G7_9BACT|nr:hypothetical protein [Marivirga aurantiaca]MBK6266643.1 hypothetical protein [Marivirga aurantiaca]
MLSSALSSYWIIVCLLIGLAYAYILYAFGKKPWPRNWNIALFVLRFLGVSLIAFLFLEPFLSNRTSQSEKANIVFLWDDSQSIQNSLPNEKIQQTWTEVNSIATKLRDEKEVNVDIINLKGENLLGVDSVNQVTPVSPLDPGLKQISNQYDNDLIAEVVLFSDGIFNRGISPEYFAYPFTVSTVGIGDTIEKKDVELKNLRYNKVSYEGNKFPVVAEIVQNGWEGEETTVGIYKNGKLIEEQTITFESGSSVEEVTFLMEADEKGYQSYTVRAKPFEEEFNKRNNQQMAYVNVVEGKKKILLLARAPHPDVKALQQSISQNENYEIHLVVAGLDEYKEEEYDLAILFHLPDKANSFQAEIRELSRRNVPLWVITGPGMDIDRHNSYNKSVQLKEWTDTDEAGAYINSNFNKFELTSGQKNQLNKLPPINVPFVDYKVNPRAEVLFFRQIGNVKTDKPLFVFYTDDETRQATLLIEGFWKWRLVEHMNTGSFEFFDEWVMKSVRYLTANNEKDQFKLYTAKDEFTDTEQIIFRVEQYNEVYDRIYGNRVNLILKNEADSSFEFQFTPDRVQPDFELRALPSGIYRYTAVTEISGKRHTASGQFVVSNFAIEQQNLVADFELLKRVAHKNEGQFFYANETDSLLQYLTNKEYPKIVSGKIEKQPLTENYWLYGIVFLILFLEWFMRRYYGSY